MQVQVVKDMPPAVSGAPPIDATPQRSAAAAGTSTATPAADTIPSPFAAASAAADTPPAIPQGAACVPPAQPPECEAAERTPTLAQAPPSEHNAEQGAACSAAPASGKEDPAAEAQPPAAEGDDSQDAPAQSAPSKPASTSVQKAGWTPKPFERPVTRRNGERTPGDTLPPTMRPPKKQKVQHQAGATSAPRGRAATSQPGEGRTPSYRRKLGPQELRRAGAGRRAPPEAAANPAPATAGTPAPPQPAATSSPAAAQFPHPAASGSTPAPTRPAASSDPSLVAATTDISSHALPEPKESSEGAHHSHMKDTEGRASGPTAFANLGMESAACAHGRAQPQMVHALPDGPPGPHSAEASSMGPVAGQDLQPAPDAAVQVSLSPAAYVELMLCISPIHAVAPSCTWLEAACWCSLASCEAMRKPSLMLTGEQDRSCNCN